MRTLLATIAVCLAPVLTAQNLVPNGEFSGGATGWTNTQFNDPLGTTGIALARVTRDGPSLAVFADFQTLTPVMSSTWLGTPFAMPATTLPVSFNVMWEKQVTTPIPSTSVNRVELRIRDVLTNAIVQTFTRPAPNQTGLFEYASFSSTFTAPAAGVYVAELFLRHSNLANMPYITWVDDVVVGAPVSFTFGVGCAGTNGLVPVLDSVNEPLVNSANFQIELHDAFSPTLALFALDFSRTVWQGLPLPFAIGGGCELKVGMSVSFPQPVLAGTAVQTLPIPNIPTLSGTQFFCQWGVFDAAAANPYGIATTAGLGFTIQ